MATNSKVLIAVVLCAVTTLAAAKCHSAADWSGVSTARRLTAASPDARCLACLNFTDRVAAVVADADFDMRSTNFFMQKLCPSLPTDWQPTCMTLFLSKGSNFASLARQKYDNNVCFSAGFCKPSLELLTDANPDPQPEPEPKPEPGPERGPEPTPKPDNCTTCKKLVEETREELKKHAADAKEYLLSTCDATPALFKPTCINVATFMGDKIKDLLVAAYNAMDADALCSFLCTAGRNAGSNEVQAEKRDLKETAVALSVSTDGDSNPLNIFCTTCQKLVINVREWIKTHNLDVKEFMYGVCDKVSPAEDVDQCKAVADKISEKVKELVDAAVAALDETVICASFCPSPPPTNKSIFGSLFPWKSARALLESNPAKKATSLFDIASEVAPHAENIEPLFDVCKLCTAVIDSAAQSLNNTEVKEEVAKIAEGFCTFMPKATRKDCKQTVDDFNTTIFDLIAYFLSDPEELCGSIGLCAFPDY